LEDGAGLDGADEPPEDDDGFGDTGVLLDVVGVGVGPGEDDDGPGAGELLDGPGFGSVELDDGCGFGFGGSFVLVTDGLGFGVALSGPRSGRLDGPLIGPYTRVAWKRRVQRTGVSRTSSPVRGASTIMPLPAYMATW
jgi:hypothetical protein